MNITEILHLTPNESLTLVFSGVVAFSAIVYAILTWKLVSETQKMREAQTEPVISIIIEQSNQLINLIDLVVKNIGLGPAYNLQFMVNPDFIYEKDQKLSDISFIKNGIQYLAPQQEIRFFLTSLVENYQTKKENPFSMSVTYESFSGKKYERKYPIDFSIWDGLHFVGGDSLVKMSKSLEEINRDLHNIAIGFNRLKIICYTTKDIEQEEQDFLEIRERFRKMEEDKKDT